MNHLFPWDYSIVLVKLLIVHFLIDFAFQTKKWIEDKEQKGPNSYRLYLHSVMQGIGAYLVLPGWNHWIIPIIIASSHFIIDLVKSYKSGKWECKFLRVNPKRAVTSPKALELFLIDQTSHILVILLCWLFLYKEWNTLSNAMSFYLSDYRVVVIAFAYVLCIWPAGHLIRRLVGLFPKLSINNSRAQNDSPQVQEPDNVGMYIGWMERILVLTLILIGQYEAIGFFIAAKSLLRFDSENKAVTEYVLIGTLFSFGFAILVGVITIHTLGV
jgi:hypothetical protein